MPTLLIAALLVCAGVTATARAEVIDRIFAVVGNTIVTQSDVYAAIRLGLEKPPAGVSDPIAAVLERIIERHLTLAEVERYAPPAPAESEVSLRLEQVRLSFSSAEAFRKALAESGLAEADLRRHVTDDLRIATYLQQRFGSTARPPSEQDILDYYASHQAEFTRNGVVRSFDEAHDDARAALVAQLRQKDVRDWLAGLRRRGNVSLLYSSR